VKSEKGKCKNEVQKGKGTELQLKIQRSFKEQF
jgi:hypothetical protein